jgi:nitrite reductase (NADH) large subunit
VVSVFSAGRTGERDNISQLRTVSWRSYDSGAYRKLLLQRNRLVGVIAYGEWGETSRAQESVQHARRLWPWQIRRFLRYGRLWPEQDASNVCNWPAATVVCQCTNTTRGALDTAIRAGHSTLDALCAHTGAASVCGSCKPLLAELTGGQPLVAEKGSRTLIWSAAVSLLAALAILISPAIPYAHSVQIDFRWDLLWRESLIKQISGFSLLGIGIMVSLISLRKRIKRFSLGSFTSWRVIHVLLGLLAVATLVAHTGLRLGDHLNLYLMLIFIGLLLAGAIASGVIGLQHVLPQSLARRTRELSLWIHIGLLWPLPGLLGFHILKTYWF